MVNKNEFKPKYLLRYTTLPVLLDILHTEKITLLDPSHWDDKNDSFYIERYKEMKSLKTLLAICFTTKNETYHHWKVFGDTAAGVCIIFDKDKFLGSLSSDIKHGEVDYLLINQAKDTLSDIEKLPFIKRKAFKDEKEYRVIYETKRERVPVVSLDFDISSISQVKLSPWIPVAVASSVQEFIRRSHQIDISKTTLIENEKWKDIARLLTASKSK